jgi:hypothetical protein
MASGRTSAQVIDELLRAMKETATSYHPEWPAPEVSTSKRRSFRVLPQFLCAIGDKLLLCSEEYY